METELYICVETATGTLVAIEIEPKSYVRKDDPYFNRGRKAYINQELPPLGTVIEKAQLEEWEPHKANANERDTLYKLEGPKISTSIHIDGFRA